MKEDLQGEIGMLEGRLTDLQTEWKDNGFEEFELQVSVRDTELV